MAQPPNIHRLLVIVPSSLDPLQVSLYLSLLMVLSLHFATGFLNWQLHS